MSEYLRNVWIEPSPFVDGVVVVTHDNFGQKHNRDISKDEAKVLLVELGEALGIEDSHFVVFNEFDGWTIEHPLSCRLSGEMAHCVTNKVVTNDCRSGPPEWVSFTGGDEVRYKLVHEEEFDNWRYDKVEP